MHGMRPLWGDLSGCCDPSVEGLKIAGGIAGQGDKVIRETKTAKGKGWVERTVEA